MEALDTVEVYCSVSNTWNPLPPMAECRNGCKAALLNNTLYVTGMNKQKYMYNWELTVSVLW